MYDDVLNEMPSDTNDGLSLFINSVKLNISNCFLKDYTINQYKYNQYIRFNVKRTSHTIPFSHIQITIPDFAKCNINSFEELNDYLRKQFLNVFDIFDRATLLNALSEGKIRITQVDIYSRISYTNDVKIKNLFYELKSKIDEFEILFPNNKNINNTYEQSIYFNLSAGKTAIIYDEFVKRGMSTIKLELRVRNSNNLLRAFNIKVENYNYLNNDNWCYLNSIYLKNYYNKFCEKNINALQFSNKHKSYKIQSEINELKNSFK
jgi:hypothetical protein